MDENKTAIECTVTENTDGTATAEPKAKEPTFLEKTGRFVKRHRGKIIGAACLVGGFILRGLLSGNNDDDNSTEDNDLNDDEE